MASVAAARALQTGLKVEDSSISLLQNIQQPLPQSALVSPSGSVLELAFPSPPTTTTLLTSSAAPASFLSSALSAGPSFASSVSLATSASGTLATSYTSLSDGSSSTSFPPVYTVTTMTTTGVAGASTLSLTSSSNSVNVAASASYPSFSVSSTPFSSSGSLFSSEAPMIVTSEMYLKLGARPKYSVLQQQQKPPIVKEFAQSQTASQEQQLANITAPSPKADYTNVKGFFYLCV